MGYLRMRRKEDEDYKPGTSDHQRIYDQHTQQKTEQRKAVPVYHKKDPADVEAWNKTVRGRRR